MAQSRRLGALEGGLLVNVVGHGCLLYPSLLSPRGSTRNSSVEAQLDRELEELREILIRRCKSRSSPGHISIDADGRENGST